MGEEEGNKRRLPVWMSSAATTKNKEENKSAEAAAIKAPSAGNNNRKRAKKDAAIHPVEPKAATTSRSRRKTTKKQPTKTRRRRRSEDEEDDEEDDNIPMASVEEEEEEEEDLTVDDLLTIANQYVKADDEKEKHQKQQLTRVEASSETAVGTSVTGCTSNDMVESLEVMPTVGRLSDKTVSVSQDTTAATTISSGDAAQDMLDLFLGGLLRKPTQTQEAIKQSEAAACAAFTEEIALDEYICSQKKQSEEKEDEPLPVNVTKKKSSLRDKVAMFFD